MTAGAPSTGNRNALSLQTLALLLTTALVGVWMYLDRIDRQNRIDDENDIPGLPIYESMDRLVEAGVDSVPHLMELLTDNDAAVRRSAATALGHIGAPAAVAIPALRELINDHDASVRSMALVALGRIGIDLPEIAPAAGARLTDESAPVQESAAHLLMMAGPVAEPFALAALSDPRIDVKRKALLVLRYVTVDAESVRNALLALYRNPDDVADLRDDVMQLLLALPEPPPDVIQDGLSSTKRRVQEMAWAATLDLRDRPEVLLPILIGCLDRIHRNSSEQFDVDEVVSFDRGSPPVGGILEALLELGLQAAGAAPAVERVVRDKSLREHQWLQVLRVLNRMGRDVTEFKPRLWELFTANASRDPHLFGVVLREVAPELIPPTLGELFPHVNDRKRLWNQFSPENHLLRDLKEALLPLMPEAIDLVRSSDRDSILAGCEVLRNCGAPAADVAPELVRILQEWKGNGDSWHEFWSVSETLTVIDPVAAQAVVPRFVTIFDEIVEKAYPQTPAASGCSIVLSFLFKIAPENLEFRQCLRTALTAASPGLRQQAAEMLCTLDCDADQAIRVIMADIDEIASASGSDRGEYARLLLRLGPNAGSAIGTVGTALLRVSESDRMPWIVALGAMASPALPDDDRTGIAVEALARQLQDPPEPLMRQAAAKALSNFGPCARKAIPALEAARRNPKNCVIPHQSPYRSSFYPYSYMSPAFSNFRHRRVPVSEAIDEALARIRESAPSAH